MSILLTQGALWSAPRSALNETHIALTGDPFPDSVEDGAARVQLTMLMLRAQDYAALGDNPVEVVIQKGIRMENVYKPGSLAHELKSAIITQEASEGVALLDGRRAPAESSKTREKFTHIRATTRGVSKVQASSIRGAVLSLIRAAGPEGITLEALDELAGVSSRGYVQKLIDKDHVETVPLPAGPEVSETKDESPKK